MSRLQKNLVLLTFLNLVMMALSVWYAQDGYKFIGRAATAEAKLAVVKKNYKDTVEYGEELIKNLDEEGKRLARCVEENKLLKDALKGLQTGGSEGSEPVEPPQR